MRDEMSDEPRRRPTRVRSENRGGRDERGREETSAPVVEARRRGGRGRRARACARPERRGCTRRPGAIQARARRLAGVVRACRAIAIRVSRTLTTSAVRAAVALRAATRATGATTRRAETVAAIVAGCVCDANVRCGVPRGARRPENATRKPVRASHVFPHLTRPKPRITSDTNVALERRRARKCSD